MELIAHRGCSFDAPENSCEAFELAIDSCADRIEFDMRMTADGVPVICHDPTTGRTGDTDLVISESSYSDLRQVRLSNGESIPTLEEVCRRFGGRISFDLELKQATASRLKEVLEILDRYTLRETTWITSFDWRLLAGMRAAGFRERTGLIVGSRSFNIKQRLYELWPLNTLIKCQASDLVIHHQLTHPFLRRYLRNHQIGLVLWYAMEDESRPSHLRANLYRKGASLSPQGLIISRIKEARRVLEE